MNDNNRPGRMAGLLASAHEFPTARYFQAHFEFLYENLAAITQDLAVLKQRIEALESVLRPEQAEAATKPPDNKYHSN